MRGHEVLNLIEWLESHDYTRSQIAECLDFLDTGEGAPSPAPVKPEPVHTEPTPAPVKPEPVRTEPTPEPESLEPVSTAPSPEPESPEPTLTEPLPVPVPQEPVREETAAEPEPLGIVEVSCSKKYYRLKYRLAIRHSADNNKAHEHNHVLEIEAYAFPMMENFQEFNYIEKHVDDCLKRFQDQYLNDLPEFKGDASLENTGEVLFPLLYEELRKNQWDLQRFEISETPLRVYIITKDSFRRRCL